MRVGIIIQLKILICSVVIGEMAFNKTCDSKSCAFGRCIVDTNSRKGYRCECDEKFKGENCDIDVDECLRSDVCYKGTCRNLIPTNINEKGYECVCPDGYSGQKCDFEDNCANHTADEGYCNNGICQDGFCACMDGWAGFHCNHAVPPRKYFSRCSRSESVVDFCLSSYGDGKCDLECAREECFYDGMDCILKETKNGDVKAKCLNTDYCNQVFGDGHCDPSCNSPQCGFDGGDCNSVYNLLDLQLLAITIKSRRHDIAKSIRDVQITISRLLFSPFVKVASDHIGDLIYEWKPTEGSESLTLNDIGDRINVKPDLSVSVNASDLTKLVVFFDIASNDCLMRKERIQSELNSTLNKANCFDSVKTASRYLKNELVRKPESLELLGDSVQITDVKVYKAQAPSWRYRLYWFLFGLLCAALMYITLYTVIVHLKKQKKRKECYAPIWNIPKQSPMFKNENFTSFSPPSLYECSPKKDLGTFQSPSFHDNYCTFPSYEEEPPLIQAVRRCDIEAVTKMIRSPDTVIDSVDSQGLGVLHHAVGNNDYNMLKLLLESGEFDVFETNNNGQIPLVYAARIGHPQLDSYALLIHAMEKRRFSSESSGGDSSDSAYESSRRTNLPLSGEFGAAWSLCDDSGRNSVHYAAINNLHHLIHYLVAYGANPSLRDGKGDSPLHLACKHGHLDAVRTLLNCNADLAVVDGDDLTPFQVSMRYGHWDILQYMKSGRITYTPVSRSRRIKRPRVISSFISESDSDYNSFDKEETIKRARTLVVPLSSKKSLPLSRGPPLYSIENEVDTLINNRYDCLNDSQSTESNSAVYNPFILTPPAQLLGLSNSTCRSNTLPSCANASNYYYDYTNSLSQPRSFDLH